MAEVLTVTNIRKNLLKEIELLKQKKEIIITKDYKPVAVLSLIDIYKTQKRLPALLVLGARKCTAQAALKSIRCINQATNNFSKVIFVYGEGTYRYNRSFNTADLRTVKNEKINLPIITSVKCGIAALAESDKYFILTFLSQPKKKEIYDLLCDKIKKSKKDILIIRENKKSSHPIAFSRKYIDAFIKTRKELGIPYIIKKFKNDIEYVDA